MTDLPSTPREAIEAAAKVADGHVERARKNVTECVNWSPAQAEWSRARDLGLDISEAIRAIPVAEPGPKGQAGGELIWTFDAQAYSDGTVNCQWHDQPGSEQFWQQSKEAKEWVQSQVNEMVDHPEKCPYAPATPDPLTARLVEALREIEVIEAIYTLGPDHNLERARDIARAALAAAEGRGSCLKHNPTWQR